MEITKTSYQWSQRKKNWCLTKQVRSHRLDDGSAGEIEQIAVVAEVQIIKGDNDTMISNGGYVQNLNQREVKYEKIPTFVICHAVVSKMINIWNATSNRPMDNWQMQMSSS